MFSTDKRQRWIQAASCLGIPTEAIRRRIIMTEWEEEFVYRQGYLRGLEEGKKSLKTKTVKYYDEDEGVWKIGEVIVDD